MLQRIALVLFVTCTTCALCCSDDGEKTVALCRESYLQTKQAIKSVSCDVVTESYQEAGISPSGIAMPAQVTQTKLTWKESAGVIKCVESSTSGDYSRKEEFLWKDQVFKHVKRDSQTKDVYGQFFDHTGQYSSFSIWRDGFLESNHEAVERLKTKPLKYEGVEEVAGAPCYKISMDQGNATEYLWFDPKKNYLIRRTQYHPSYNKKIYFEREIEKVGSGLAVC